MQKKKCLKLIKEISQYKELECLVIENAEGGLLSYSGDVVGEENKIKFEKIAKKHGYIALGTNVSVWSSVEKMEKYGNKKTTYGSSMIQ